MTISSPFASEIVICKSPSASPSSVSGGRLPCTPAGDAQPLIKTNMLILFSAGELTVLDTLPD
jgi:hypothetical protein